MSWLWRLATRWCSGFNLLSLLKLVKAWRWCAKWGHTDMSVVAHSGCVLLSLRDALCHVIEPLRVAVVKV